MRGGVWQAAVHGVTKSRTRLSDFTFTTVRVRKKQYSSTYSGTGEKLIFGLKREETDQDRGRVKIKKPRERLLISFSVPSETPIFQLNS